MPGGRVGVGVAWWSYGVCGLAAVVGGLSMQLHLLDVGDLAGSLGVSADDASWIGTAGAAAEAAAVLAAPQLVAVFGIRRLTMASAGTAGALAAVSFVSASYLEWIRALQGFATGLLPVVMMGWCLRAFRPDRRDLPLMLFALASSLPTAFAPSLAGTATSHWGGMGSFVADLLWTAPVMLAAYLVMPREPLLLGRLRDIDWPGFGLLATGAMLIVAFLTQGERRFWLATSWMAPLLAASAVLLALAAARLLTAPRPYLDPRLLVRSTFVIGLAEALSLRFAILIASFAVPQALARLGSYRLEQSGEAVLWLVAGQLAGFPAAWAWLERRDGRWSLGFGLVVFAAASAWAAKIDPTWQPVQFAGPLALAGFGQGFFLTSVLRYATWGIPAASGATASGLFNLTRVLGTSFATGGVGYILRIRENGHSARILEGSGSNGVILARLDDLVRSYSVLTPDPTVVSASATAALARTLGTQAYVLAFADVFLAIAVVLIAFAALVPALPRVLPDRSGGGAHA